MCFHPRVSSENGSKNRPLGIARGLIRQYFLCPSNYTTLGDSSTPWHLPIFRNWDQQGWWRLEELCLSYLPDWTWSMYIKWCEKQTLVLNHLRQVSQGNSQPIRRQKSYLRRDLSRSNGLRWPRSFVNNRFCKLH